jgi:8-oxo-dGTP pyrophosphatase MutT (NUDIX family)
LRQYPSQPELVQRFLDFDRAGEQNYMRQAPGHFTASCWLVDTTGERVLLTHHRKLGRWLQLGGHADGDTDLLRVALTEAQEESGLSDLSITPEIFDLDVHEIPARASDPAHLHWDVRFVVRANGSLDFVTSAESIALAWVRIADIALDQTELYDDSLRRMAGRWIATG